MFWLGLLLAFPLSIVANLVTPNVNRFLLRWNEAHRASYDRRTAEEQEEITRILSHPFRFYRYLLKLIYGHLVVLTLFFILYWVSSTAPNLLLFAYRITGTQADPKEIARFTDLFAQLHALLAYLCALVFMLALVKSSRVVSKLMHEADKV
jgi:hypothetical protein